MLTKIGLPLAAVLMLTFAIQQVIAYRAVPPPAQPLIEPVRGPYPQQLCAPGVVEPKGEQISIGTPVPGVVADVLVVEGQHVSRGQPLFRLDSRKLNAERAVRRAALAAAQANLARLMQQPRPEEIPVQQARVREATASWDLAEDELRRIKLLASRGAVTAAELNQRHQDSAMAQARLAREQAALELLEAGAWKPDVAVAEASVKTAQAELALVETELQRLVICAPLDGTLLAVDVRPGEFVAAPATRPLVVLGDCDPLQVRVDVDEYDMGRLVAGASAVAVPRGEGQVKIPLNFVRIEPALAPKRSLTGLPDERIDTRVLQVLFAVDGASHLRVGQQVDVYIDASPCPDISPSAEPPGDGLIAAARD